MKKYGKYEKKPVETTAKQPKVKSTLLQTYLTSLLGMVLCVAMFLGTSYAWFSSEVTNVANEIYIGTLDVGLYKENGDTDLDLAVETNRLLNEDIRWEPGYTAIETVHVVNEGDLAFNYTMNFTDGALKTDGELKLEEIAENFDVWVYYDGTQVAPAPGSYDDINETNNWSYVGTLEDLLSGKPVLEGVMMTVRDAQQDTTKANAGTTDGVATIDTYTIAVHMKETANDNRLMGQRITLSVKLIAYQRSQETDAFQNGNYDNIDVAPSAPLLQEALNKGGTTMLGDDITIDKLDGRVTMAGGVLNGDGKTVTYSGPRNESGSSVGVLTTNGGTVQNLTIVGGEYGRALYVTELKSDLFVENCTLSGAYAFNLNSAAPTAYSLFFTNTTFESWTSYSNVMKHAYFTDCTFKSVLRPYGDTTLENCEFTTEGLNTKGLEAGKTVTLINCTYNGVDIDQATVKADAEGNITVTCDTVALEIVEDTVVLKVTTP